MTFFYSFQFYSIFFISLLVLFLPFFIFYFQQKMDFELSSSTLIESFERYKGGNSSTNDQILSKSVPENEEKEREVEVSMMIRALFLFYFSSFYYFHLSFFLVTLKLPIFYDSLDLLFLELFSDHIRYQLFPDNLSFISLLFTFSFPFFTLHFSSKNWQNSNL